MKPALLLVDDEPYILKCLCRVFFDMECKIYTAESAAAALGVLATNKVDIFISDLCMPEINGIEFLREVAASYPSTARVILTGYAKHEDLAMAIQEDIINTYLWKPFDNEALIRTIKQLLNSTSCQRLASSLVMRLEEPYTELSSDVDSDKERYPCPVRAPVDIPD